MRRVDLPDGWHLVPGGQRKGVFSGDRYYDFMVKVSSGKIVNLSVKEDASIVRGEDFSYIWAAEARWGINLYDLFTAPDEWAEDFQVWT